MKTDETNKGEHESARCAGSEFDAAGGSANASIARDEKPRAHNYMPELIMALCGINPICETCHEALGLCRCNSPSDGDELPRADADSNGKN